MTTTNVTKPLRVLTALVNERYRDVTSVEPFEVEACACNCHSGEVNTCPFKERNVFNRQFGRDVFSPEFIVSRVFLKVEQVSPRIIDGERFTRVERMPRLRPFEDLYFSRKTGAATAPSSTGHTAGVQRPEL